MGNRHACHLRREADAGERSAQRQNDVRGAAARECEPVDAASTGNARHGARTAPAPAACGRVEYPVAVSVALCVAGAGQGREGREVYVISLDVDADGETESLARGARGCGPGAARRDRQRRAEAGDRAAVDVDVCVILLRHRAEAERGAQFVCVLALVRHADDPLPMNEPASLPQGSLAQMLATFHAARRDLAAQVRDLAVLLEAAVRNTILQLRGIDSMQDFMDRQQRMMLDDEA